MTATQFDQMLDEGFDLDSSYSNGALYSNPPSDLGKSPKSPGRQPARSSAEPSSSRSPASTPHILTPSTSTLDYHGDIPLTENPEAPESISTSPGTNVTHISEDYVHVPGRFSGQPGSAHNRAMGRPPPASTPGAHSHAHFSREPSVAPSASANSSQWPLFNTTMSDGGWPERQHPSSQFGNLFVPVTGVSGVSEDDIISTDALLADFAGYSDTSTHDFNSFPQFRGLVVPGNSHHVNQPDYVPQAAHNDQMQQQWSHQTMGFTPIQSPDTQLRVPHTFTDRQRTLSPHSHPLTPSTARFSTPRRLPPTSRTPMRGVNVLPHPQNQQMNNVHLQVPTSAPMNQPTRRIEAAPAGSSRQGATQSLSERRNRGGRPRGQHLQQAARDRSHKMRKTGACWRCALQRDPVSYQGWRK
jgi:hypothetical protein